MRALYLLFFGCLCWAPSSFADLSSAQAAYHRGDYLAAGQEYADLATKGDATAQSVLGYMYEVGLGVPQDKTKAINWYRKAADQGNVYANDALRGLRIVHSPTGSAASTDEPRTQSTTRPSISTGFYVLAEDGELLEAHPALVEQDPGAEVGLEYNVAEADVFGVDAAIRKKAIRDALRDKEWQTADPGRFYDSGASDTSQEKATLESSPGHTHRLFVDRGQGSAAQPYREKVMFGRVAIYLPPVGGGAVNPRAGEFYPVSGGVVSPPQTTSHKKCGSFSNEELDDLREIWGVEYGGKSKRTYSTGYIKYLNEKIETIARCKKKTREEVRKEILKSLL